MITGFIQVYEDSKHGIKEAAHFAKMHPIGVTTQHEDRELVEAGAKDCCQSLADALKIGLLSF